MNINIQSLHFSANQDLQDFITEKVNKFISHHGQVESADVILKLDNTTETDNKICEIKFSIPGNDLFAKRQAKSFEEASTEVLNALQHQVDKAKGKAGN